MIWLWARRRLPGDRRRKFPRLDSVRDKMGQAMREIQASPVEMCQAMEELEARFARLEALVLSKLNRPHPGWVYAEVQAARARMTKITEEMLGSKVEVTEEHDPEIENQCQLVFRVKDRGEMSEIQARRMYPGADAHRRKHSHLLVVVPACPLATQADANRGIRAGCTQDGSTLCIWTSCFGRCDEWHVVRLEVLCWN